MRRTLAAAATALTLLGVAGPAVGADRIARLADNLGALRAEVDTLAESIDAAGAAARASSRSTAAQVAELELQIQRAELRARRLARDAAAAGEGAASLEAARVALDPVLAGALERAGASIKAGLPFKREERLERLEAIERELRAGAIPPERAAARLWSFLEDEGRMARESGLYKQTVSIEGREVLADVARIGMVALYFRAADGRAGYVRRDGESWRGEVLDDAASNEAIAALFSAFGRGIRVGSFRLPNPLISL